MSFLVTARKWRPQKFDDVVGQEHITTTLKNAIKSDRIAHAYLFTGPRGVGKTTTARIFAKSINCLNPQDAEPCNKCEMCSSISTSQSLDIIEIDGASNRGIDEVRALRESVKYAPSKGAYKIYIIDEVHMLTRESFNAFLKTLEEPPAHTIFIFATTDAHKVPLTIISRCQRFDFRRIQLDTIKSTLLEIAASEKIEIDDKTLTIIAKKSDGALRDAESFFDQVVAFCGNKIDSDTVAKMLNLVDEELYFRISDAILQKDFKEVYLVSARIYENGWNFVDFMDGLTEHFRNILSVILTEQTGFVESADIYKQRYAGYMGKFSTGDILRLLGFLNKTSQELRYSQNHRLKIEISLSHLIGLERSETISEIINKINNPDSVSVADAAVKSSVSGKEIKKKTELLTEAKLKKPTNAAPDKRHEVKENKNPDPPAESFDSILYGWANFTELVAKEKQFTLGPFIKKAIPKIEGSRIGLSIDDDAGLRALKFDEAYLVKKAFDLFNKKILFSFNQISESSPQNADTVNTDIRINRKPEEDPFAEMIIKELGGEEIT